MAVGTPQVGTVVEDTAHTTTAVGFPATVNASDRCVLGGSVASLSLVTKPATFTTDTTHSLASDTALPDIYFAHLTAAAAGTEGGTTVTVTHPNAVSWWQILAFPGVDATSPVDFVSYFEETVAQAGLPIPGGTCSSDGSALVAFGAQNGTANTATPPASFTETGDRATGTRIAEMSYLLSVAAGATGTKTITWSGSAKSMGVLVCLRPVTSAGFGDGTGVASDAAGSVAPTAGLGDGTGTAFDATVTVSPNAGLPDATGTAFNAAGSVSPTAGNATATATAFDATGLVSPTAGFADSTGQAFDAAGSVSATAGLASGTGISSDAALSVGVPSDFATGTGSAFDATVTTALAVGTAATSTSTVVLSSGHWSPSMGKFASTSAVSGRSSVSVLSGAGSTSTVTGPSLTDDGTYDGLGGFDEAYPFD